MGFRTGVFLLGFYVVALVQAFDLHQRQNNPQLLSYCTELVMTCPPVASSCVSSLCASCQPIGGPTFSSCCSQTSPAACFSENFFTASDGGSITSTRSSAARTTGGPNTHSESCYSAFSRVESCESKTPSFTDLNDRQQASCLCYSGSTWNPDAFDELYTHCYSYFKTELSSKYATVTDAGGICSSVGNILSGTASAGSSASKSTTPSTSRPSTAATASIPTVSSTSTSAPRPISNGAGSSVPLDLFPHLLFLGSWLFWIGL